MSRLLLGIVALAGFATASQAATISTAMTADNHYAIYADNGGVLTYIGGNELGRDGDPGQFNWSLPEGWDFAAITAIYVAAWSDDSTAHGLLGNLTIDGNDFSSGNAAWRVYDTGMGRVDGSPHPTTTEIAGILTTANTNNAFTVTSSVGTNGVAPWGVVPGINSSAAWMWSPAGGRTGPNDTPSYVVFCLPVPSPSALALVGLGGLVAARRKR